MCIVSGALAHRCPAVVGPSELLPQNSVEVASVSELETVESGPEMQTWTPSGGMQRLDSQKILELPTFWELETLRTLVLYCLGRSGSQKVLESSMFLEVEAAKLLFL